ncbi:MAG: hypothetical protein JF606_28545 [Burkholderiales bacterium]|nr:hypothetical protein [Burkholderiales bacterium]
MALIDMLTNRRNTVWCLRMRCRSSGSGLELHENGVLALAAIQGSDAATLLLADMSLWSSRDPGTLSLTAAIDEYVKAAYQRLIAPRGVPMDRVRIVEWDACGNFDFFATTTVGGYFTHVPVFGLSRMSMPRSREAFLSWTGATGAALLSSAERAMGGPALSAAH